MIDIRQLSVEVNGHLILKNIDMNIPQGEVHLLLGPNGSGKTSLLSTISGYPDYKVVEGSIKFDGKDILGLGLTERARLGIGLLEQRPPAIDGVTLRMLLDYIIGADADKKRRVESYIDEARLEKLVDRNVHENLSGGEIKKAGVLLLLAREPAFSMMDEPDSGVDMDSLTLLCSMINRLLSKEHSFPVMRKTGLIITHSDAILNTVYADKAHVLINGHIVCSGNPRLIMSKIAESGFDACANCEFHGGQHE